MSTELNTSLSSVLFGDGCGWLHRKAHTRWSKIIVNAQQKSRREAVAPPHLAAEARLNGTLRHEPVEAGPGGLAQLRRLLKQAAQKRLQRKVVSLQTP